jgi:hypothetical protein
MNMVHVAYTVLSVELLSADMHCLMYEGENIEAL